MFASLYLLGRNNLNGYPVFILVAEINQQSFFKLKARKSW